MVCFHSPPLLAIFFLPGFQGSPLDLCEPLFGQHLYISPPSNLDIHSYHYICVLRYCFHSSGSLLFCSIFSLGLIAQFSLPFTIYSLGYTYSLTDYQGRVEFYSEAWLSRNRPWLRVACCSSII